jgi:enamine deaminase RidA (YjgF/YER057c/UK114 family)
LAGFFPVENLPTSTWIGVPALASKDFLIEIEAVDMRKSGSAKQMYRIIVRR